MPPVRSKRLFEPAAVPPVRSKRLFERAVRDRCSQKLVSGALCSEPLHSALLCSVHGYARVHTSIYIYIYIYIMILLTVLFKPHLAIDIRNYVNNKKIKKNKIKKHGTKRA